MLQERVGRLKHYSVQNIFRLLRLNSEQLVSTVVTRFGASGDA